MSSKYYPEFYLRRKRQQQAYLRVTVVVSVIVIVGLGVLAASYVFRAFISNRAAAPGATPSLADEQRSLVTQQRIDSAANPAVDGKTEASEEAAAAEVKLADIDYAESFPQISIGPAGMQDAASAASPPAGEESGLGAEAAEPSAVVGQDDAAGAAEIPAGAANGSEDAAADSAAEKERLAKEQARKEEAKKEEARKEQAKKDQAKKEQERRDKEQAAEAKKAEQPKGEEPAATAKVRYRVYAGKFLSEEEAKQGKASLSALGVGAGAQIIDTKAGDFLLLVTVLDGLEAATALKGKLVDSGFGGAFVTRKSGS